MKRMLLALGRTLLCGLLTLPFASAGAADCSNWPDWVKFRGHFINDGGRVIDPSTPDGQTTSEGQSYALFFSLVANDTESFGRILRWTENNLAQGDLTAHLPAWQWGKKADGSWGVLDANAASDADLWIAYTLIEAGRLWNKPRYTALGELLADRIVREETAELPGLGLVMLPGPQGFRPAADAVRLNPSYFPMQVMRRMSVLYPGSAWPRLSTSALDTLVRSSPKGFAPNWTRYDTSRGFLPDADSHAKGSYDAIRVYLWAGMLDGRDTARAPLLRTFSPMLRKIEENGVPPLEIDTQRGTTEGTGPAGFSSAVLPLLAAANKPELVRQQRARIEAFAPSERNDNYYEQTLTLFGLGWLEKRYRFARDGALQPRWICSSR